MNRQDTFVLKFAFAVSEMMAGSKAVDDGVSLAREASRSMDSIVGASSQLVDMVHQIAVAAEQQSATAEEISHNMEGTSGLISHSADSSEQIDYAARGLAKLAVEIRGYMDWFKVGDSGNGNMSA